MAAEVPQVHLAIGSQFENIELVQIVVEESLRKLDLDEATAHSIGLAVREAVANAIKHGNQQDPDKRVDVDFEIKQGEVVIEVTDQGTGFDLLEVKDPLNPDNLLRPNGRGIFFMNSFMDTIDYSFKPEGGTVVTLRKRLASATMASRPQEENDE
jgi:serine/threonine-protein kinase RsbW